MGRCKGLGRLLRRAATLGALAALSACSPIKTLNTLEPSGAVTVSRDIAYAPGPRHGLDVYAPKRPRPGAPVVVFFYGGSWQEGDKALYRFVGEALATRGYVTVIPDYRLYPQVRYPGFLEDNALAVRWARDHAGDYGGDGRRLVLMGHSAGAYDAAMLSLDRTWLAKVGMDPRRDVRAMVGLAGPYDFLPLKDETLKVIFGPVAQRPATQPIAYADGQGPPLFLAAARGDTTVEPENTTRLAARVRQNGGVVEERYYDHLNHALMVGVIAAPLRVLAPVLSDLSRFIDAHTADGATP